MNLAPYPEALEYSRRLRCWEQARALAEEQAEDAGLWFVAQTAPEAYLQVALRKLHAAVEGTS